MYSISSRFLRMVHRAQLTGQVFVEGLDRLKVNLGSTKLGRTMPVRLAVRVVQEMGDDDATHMAASVSYYAVLSLFPLVLGLSAIVGVVANSPERQEQVIEFIVDKPARFGGLRSGKCIGNC